MAKKKKNKNKKSPPKVVPKSQAKVGDVKKISGNTVLKYTSKDLGISKSSSSSSSSKSTPPPTVNYTYDPKKESASQYNARIEKERNAVNSYKEPKDEEKDTSDEEKDTPYDDSGLLNSDEYKRLPKDQQEVLRTMLEVISGNDQKKAVRLIESFKAMQKINDPYFAQQLGLAIDGIKRGYVAIDKQAEFEELQMRTRLKDLKADYESKKSFMNLEQAQMMKDIQTGYEQNLETLQTGLAESGFTSSSRRVQKEGILNEATGDLRESKNRAFAYETNALDEVLGRSERDTANEVARLAELTKAGKLDFLRSAEKQIGSDALDDLNLDGAAPLGGIYGDINEKKLQDTISSMSSFVF